MGKSNGHRKPLPNPAGKKIELTLMQGESGACFVMEFDYASGEEKQVAIFLPETRVVTAKGAFGPELANRDMAQIRAMIFVDTYLRLVNENLVKLD